MYGLREIRIHPLDRQFGISQQACAIRENEQLRQVRDIASALKPANHAEVPLVPIQICEKRQASFIVEGRRSKDVSR
jgi:hypothetical protein